MYNSYMEKVAFLQRVDDRRLSHLKAGQKASKRWNESLCIYLYIYIYIYSFY